MKSALIETDSRFDEWVEGEIFYCQYKSRRVILAPTTGLTKEVAKEKSVFKFYKGEVARASIAGFICHEISGKVSFANIIAKDWFGDNLGHMSQVFKMTDLVEVLRTVKPIRSKTAIGLVTSQRYPIIELKDNSIIYVR